MGLVSPFGELVGSCGGALPRTLSCYSPSEGKRPPSPPSAPTAPGRAHVSCPSIETIIEQHRCEANTRLTCAETPASTLYSLLLGLWVVWDTQDKYPARSNRAINGQKPAPKDAERIVERLTHVCGESHTVRRAAERPRHRTCPPPCGVGGTHRPLAHSTARGSHIGAQLHVRQSRV